MATAHPPAPDGAPPEPIYDEYVQERVAYHARRLAKVYWLSKDERDDAAQELWLELCKAAQRFEPEGAASWHTYACRVLDLAVLKWKQGRARRRDRERVRTFYCTFADESQSDVGSIYDFPGDEVDLDLRLDVAMALADLPDRLSQTCSLLMEHPPSEAARRLGIHRSSIYRLQREVREHLGEHFKEFC